MNFLRIPLLFYVIIIYLAVHGGLAGGREVARQDFKAIRIERTSCFGWCPSYSLTIRANGEVEYEGKSDVAVKGLRRGVVSKLDIIFLFEAAERLKFKSLQDQYEGVKDGCKEVWTDLPSIVITFDAGEFKKNIRYYMGCRGMVILERIAWFADTVDEVGQVSQWTGPRMRAMDKDVKGG